MSTIALQRKEYKPNNVITTKRTSTFFGPSIIQKKLSIGASNDAYEIEADRMADQVVGMSDVQVQKQSKGALVQRKCSACEEEHVQKKSIADGITPRIQKEEASSADVGIASDSIHSRINTSKGSGHAMDKSTQTYMESRFGTDFSSVRLHTNTNAKQLSNELSAQAFTVGNDIYFNEGKYNPTAKSGKHLLAHELTHTLQQGGIQRKMIQRVLARQTSCTNNPLNLPSGGTITDPLSDLTSAVNKAVEFLDTSIGDLDYTRNQILGGAPIAWPTIGDSLARAISIVGYDPNSRVFWTSRSGLNRASLLLRRLRAFRASLADNGMFYVCLGPNTGTIGICTGGICNTGWAATCEGSFIIHLCEGF